MTTWQIPLFKVYDPPWEILAPALRQVLASGYWAEGDEVAKFAENLKAALHVKAVVPTSSCTMAIHVALKALGIKHGSRVAASPMTCVASVVSAVHLGAEVIWYDVEPDTGMIAPHPGIKADAAIVPSWGGDVPNWAAAQELDCPIVADFAQGIGAFRGPADLTCYSFQAIKHISTGDGGCIATDHANLAERCQRLSYFGIDRKAFRTPTGDINGAMDIPEVGFKANMNNIAAAIGNVQLQFLQGIINRHRQCGFLYEKLLADVAEVVIPKRHGQSSNWVFTVTCDRRDELLAHLQSKGIQASPVHTRIDTYSGIGAKKRDLYGLESFSARHICLPSGWWLDETDVRDVVKEVKAFYV